MKKIILDTETYEVPSEWNELTIEHLVFLIGLTNKAMPVQEVRVKMFLFCIGGHISQNYFNKTFVLVIGKKKYPITTEQLAIISGVVDFLFSRPDDEGNYHLEPKLTRNPFPMTKCGCITVRGPGDGLTNITYDQFIMLQTYQQRMPTHPEAINEFISVIYKRNTFNTDSQGEPAIIKQMSPTVKTAILWFYLGTLNFIGSKFPRVFSGGGENSGGTVFENQMKILDTLADGDVTKKPEVRNALLYDALFTMELAIERQERMKAK